jgi:predicted transcriptional regulator
MIESAMTLSVKLDPDAEARLKALAEARRQTPDVVLKEAIEQYLERSETRLDFKAEALASLGAFQEGGLHLTLAETEAWLDGWGTTTETALPPCHK